MTEERNRAGTGASGPARPPRPATPSTADEPRAPGRAGAVLTTPSVPLPAPGGPPPPLDPVDGAGGPDVVDVDEVFDPAVSDRDAGHDMAAHDHQDHDDLYDDDFVELDDDDFVELPAEGRIPRWVGVLAVFAVIGFAVVGGGYWWYQRQINPPGGPGETVAVSIPRGSSLSGIGSILDSEGIIPNAIVFNFHASRKGAGPYDAGVYELRKNSDIDSVLETMDMGPTGELQSTEVAKATIPEGLTQDEITARVADQIPRLDLDRMESALADGKVTSSLRPDGKKSYEGLLFPATYEVGGSETEIDVLDTLAGEMETRVRSNDPDAAKARIKKQFGIEVSTYDLLTVASLVQAEAGNAEEAPKIAAVMYNRLAEDSTALTLGIDAVDDYGAKKAGVDVNTFRETSQPYNTRLVKGLPPTPISAPGDYALTAAFAPADGAWIYYVLTDPGVHSFAVTDAEFQQFKQECIAKDLGCG